MKRLMLVLLALLWIPQAMAQDEGAVRAAIETALTDSVGGWNAGNIDRFMAIYSDDPATSFTTDRSISRGKEGMKGHYLVVYPEQFRESAAAAPLTLTIGIDRFQMLGTDYALVVGHWKLLPYQDEAKAKVGMTTLIFHREADGWKIIADHSSLNLAAALSGC
jgi:ketosteroid isomerase-like protein